MSYLRVVNNQSTSTHLIFAKTCLKLLSKKVTRPRDGTSGAHLGAKVISFLTEQMLVKFASVTLWTDSKCVLSWYHSSKLLPVFIRNRIQRIKKENINELHYIPSHFNPADLLTKSNIYNSDPEFWWKGPAWLCESKKKLAR